MGAETEIITQVIDAGVKTGNNTFIWVGVGIFIFQLVLIPVVGFLFKHFNNKSEEKTKLIAQLSEDKIKAERELTGYKRDNEFKEVHKEIDDFKKEVKVLFEKKTMEQNHQAEELSMTLKTMNEVINETANKTNEIYKKVFNIN